MKKYIIIFLVTYSIISFSCKSETNEKEYSAKNNKKEIHTKFNGFLDGDIIFQTSQSTQSKAIQLSTKSKYSHMGIIFKEGDQFVVYEAVQPVKITPFLEWINKGEDKKYVVKRLVNRKNLFNPDVIQRMRTEANTYLGKDYDPYFNWSDEKIYCSELVWKIYKEVLDIKLGQLQQLKEFDLSHQHVKMKLKERYGNKIPMEQIVISPASMYESEKLINVLE